MTREEQIGFVSDILRAIGEDITDKIEDDRIPKEWDGMELRFYIADIASDNAVFVFNTGQRRKQYELVCLANNL